MRYDRPFTFCHVKLLGKEVEAIYVDGSGCLITPEMPRSMTVVVCDARRGGDEYDGMIEVVDCG